MRRTSLISAFVAGMFSHGFGADVPESLKAAREFFQAGRITELSNLVEGELRSKTLSQPGEAYFAAEALLALGRPADALKLADEIEANLPRSMVGPFLRFRAAELAGRSDEARKIAVERINRSDVTGYWWGRSALDWALLGKLKMGAGVDAKVVLETCYERALRDDPACEEACVFVVELALSCGDFELAGNRAREYLKRFPKNATLFALWGNALQWSSQKEALLKWHKALELNPSLSIARYALAEIAFVTEDSAGLDEQLNKLPQWDPESGAIRLACAHAGLRNDAALKTQASVAKNPWALHRAGVLLSGRYRFAEGEELQKKALALDPELLHAKRALAQDLLRLGRSSEAWTVLEEVHRKDGYDITVFNLLELRDRVAGFTKVESEHFDVWMAPSEAAVYADRVTQLLERAHAALVAKYQFKLRERTTVEIFPEQKDFAVRTFGVPGGDGYLGVCFGNVITAPSPASPRAAGHSWEATLWHEFTHTVTLTLTRNRMPRWLSEGISVHEEQQANRGWGQRFKPRHAGRLIKGELTPIERMSEAFRTVDGTELDFAYFQAGLIVDWLVKKSGSKALRALLEDLGKGLEIHDAISKRYGPIGQLNLEFSKYAADWATDLAGSLKWKAASQVNTAALKDSSEKSDEKSYEDFIREGERAFRARDYQAARNCFEAVLNAAPNVPDSEGALFWLIKTYRALGLDELEVATLRRCLDTIADFAGAHERLIELYSKSGDWERLVETARQQLSVNPMSIGLIEGLAIAHERLGQNALAVAEFERALRLNPERAPRWHSKIGILLENSAPSQARSHLLDALEVNPRDRTALEALARIVLKHPSAAQSAEPLHAFDIKREASPGIEKEGGSK